MKIRVNDVGAESVAYITKGNEKETTLSMSICKYHPNRYYGMLEEYLESGWEDKGEYIHTTEGNVSMHKSTFLEKEHNYIIAFIHLHKGEKETELVTVGDRLLYIEEEDKKAFFEVYKLADMELHKKAMFKEKKQEEPNLR
jgi:hypothetical protein